MTAIELRDVFCVHRTDQGDAAALQGLSLDVQTGELLCVLGPSGAGKTTLLQVIAGLRVPSAGVVRVLGRDVGRLRERGRAAFRHAQIGFLDQHPESALPPDLSVAQSVALPLLLRGVARSACRARVGELLSAAGLTDVARARPASLSGGERQRVALCAALSHRPALLLADEPTGELDDAAAETVLGLIAELSVADGTTVIVVSHDQATAERARRTVRIRDGRVAEEQRSGDRALVVDRGGWVQLPGELLASVGIEDRARVELLDVGLVLTPADPTDGSAPMDGSTQSRYTPDGTSSAPRRSGDRNEARTGDDWDPARIELHSITRFRGHGGDRRKVLDGLSGVLAPGLMTVVTGRSGAGKTTLLRLLAALDVPDAGDVVLDDSSLGDLDAEELAALRRQRIGYLPQEPSPVPFLSAAENVALVLALRGCPASLAAERAAAMLARVGLEERAHQRVARLSAGEVQRVALARGLACARGLLVVDEPTSRLDEANAAAVGELLAAAAAEGHHTVVCATHDPQVIRHAGEVLAL